ncbi:YciI family protein [Pedobacter sp. NJ-S-72]
MKKYALLLLLMASVTVISAQEVTKVTNKNYDAKLAKELNADEYGMKTYVLAILKTGPENHYPKAKQDSIFKGHMANITKLVSDGKLIVAGPFGKNDKSYRGIFIFDVPTIEEARKLVDTDPVIQSKLMDVDLFVWYGSAALKETLKIHSKIEKRSH